MKKLILFLNLLFLFSNISLIAQSNDSISNSAKIEKQITDLKHRFDILEKQIDDIMWMQRIGDICKFDKVFIYGPPPAVVKDSNAVGAFNPVRFWAYVFIPKNINLKKKHPLIVLPHGGVHSNFSTYYTHIIRELIAQGYVVVAPEYRGSTGYGKKFYELIDYGGNENGDAEASRKYMVENYSFVDSNRVGIIGWSHGGMIALMNLFEHPNKYKVGFAGVPVSDLVMRLTYHGADYEKYFSADYHIGQTLEENPEEYKRRSPATHAHKLQTPILINTNSNDDDVYAVEVLSLIDALKAADRNFIFDYYEDLPGGHGFDRIDTKLAREIRFKTYKFLEQYLNPPKKFKNLSDLEKITYSGN